jgi:hypothetical protein
MIVNMRGVWGILSKVGAVALAFGGTVRAVDNFRCHDSFFTVVIDSALDSRTSAYIEPIRITKARLASNPNDVKVLRELSDMWIEAANSGKIAQVYPGYYGESLIEGPKGDIYRTFSDLANKLSESAEAGVLEGDPNALLDAIRAIEVMSIVRYGSHETMFTSSAYLRRPTKVLKANLNKLTPEAKARLQRVQDPSQREAKTRFLDQVISRQRSNYALRYGIEMTKSDDSTYLTFLSGNGQNVAAAHFYGFDREIGFTDKKKSK